MKARLFNLVMALVFVMTSLFLGSVSPAFAADKNIANPSVAAASCSYKLTYLDDVQSLDRYVTTTAPGYYPAVLEFAQTLSTSDSVSVTAGIGVSSVFPLVQAEIKVQANTTISLSQSTTVRFTYSVPKNGGSRKMEIRWYGKKWAFSGIKTCGRTQTSFSGTVNEVIGYYRKIQCYSGGVWKYC